MTRQFVRLLLAVCTICIYAHAQDLRQPRGRPVITSTAIQPTGADIVFILDGSGSVTKSNFDDIFIPFIYQIASQLSLGQNGYQIAIVQFGNRGRVEVKLNETYNARELEQKAMSIRYMDEKTNTTGGLLETLEIFNTNGYGARGGDWAKIGILLTDGKCTSDCFRFSNAAEQLEADGINMLAIGIGDDISMIELKTVASTDDDVMLVNLYSELRQPDFVRSVLAWITDMAQNNPLGGGSTGGGGTGGANTDSGGDGSSNLQSKGADVVFILDSSESITESVFQNSVLPFVSSVSMGLPLGESKYEIGVITYGSDASLSLRMDATNVNNVVSEISGIQFGSDMTNTSGALRTFRSLVTSATWRESSRAELPIIGVLITDGRSSLDTEQILPEAMRIQQEEGLYLMAMVVGEDGDIEEDIISCSVSEPTADHFMKFSTFDALASQVDSLLQKINTIVDTMMPEMTSTTTTQAPASVPGGDWSCDFEEEKPMCDMVQSTTDNFDWERGTGWTKSFDTGPYKAYTGDYYLFIEASNRMRGDQAVIYLPQVSSNGMYCLDFAYSMYGFHVRSLEVIRKSGSTIHVDWLKEGNQQSSWYTQMLSINLSSTDQLGFRATRGQAHTGDIAIDTIQLKSGACVIAK